MTSGLVAGTLGLIALTGLDALDALAALGIAVVIARHGVDLIRSVRPGDEGLDAAEIAAVARVLADGPPAVIGYRRLRARTAGGVRRIDVDVTVRRDATAAQVDTRPADDRRRPGGASAGCPHRGPRGAPDRSERAISDASRTMSHVRSHRSRRAMLLACIVAALLGAPAAALAEDEPIDQYYSASVEDGGWLQRIGWSWDAIQHAHYDDVAYPTIAVVDSGIDDEHPEFADDGVIDPASADCRSGRPIVSKNGDLKRVRDLENGHGTIVAGLAAAPANGLGIVGASPYSTLLVVRIVPDGLGGLACALEYLAAQMDHGPIGLLVVNLSLFDPRSPSAAVRRGIAKLVRRGALLVAATGNVGENSGTRVGFPARLPHVLAIGDAERQALLKGPELDLLAPGGSLYAPVIGGGWRPIGPPQTSYATAIASGAAAAVWGAHPDGSALTAQQVAWLLRATASRAKTWTRAQGFGTIDVGEALHFPPGRIPADDESEPNDSASDASGGLALPPLACVKTCTRRGIVGTTDDPEDWWAVRIPGNRKVCRQVGGPVSSSVVQGPKGLAYVRVTTKRASTGYTLKLRAGRNC